MNAKKKALTNKLIDIHSHAGVSIKAYACMEYPYAATIEGIRYRQLKCGIDANVVFPFTCDLHFDINRLSSGVFRPAENPVSKIPYEIENELLLREIYDYCPEICEHFLPFVSVDPGREQSRQADNIYKLAEKYEIFGVKINPVLCQSPITELLGAGSCLVELIRNKSWPVLLHTTTDKNESFSRADLAFEVISANPDIRFCLAHCIGFDEAFLRKADNLPNVWVDTSALVIQCQLGFENSEIIAADSERFSADYANPSDVIERLASEFANTIIWGSDTPAYAYICERVQAQGHKAMFKLKATYDDEVEALKSLPFQVQLNIANQNSLAFLFGER